MQVKIHFTFETVIHHQTLSVYTKEFRYKNKITWMHTNLQVLQKKIIFSPYISDMTSNSLLEESNDLNGNI